MSAAAAFVRTWRVGTYKATLSVPRLKTGAQATAVIEWEPEIPQRMNPTEAEQYRAGRDAALTDMAREMGLRVACVES